jgi:1-acyl-sn-glycerol-3-phosphate acyltransferase
MTRPKKSGGNGAPNPKRAAGARPAPKKAAAAAPARKPAPAKQKPAPAASPRPPKAQKASPRDSGAADPAVVAQIRELEAQLDRLIDQASRRDLSALAPDDDDDDDDDDDAPGVLEAAPPPSDDDDDDHGHEPFAGTTSPVEISSTEITAEYDVPVAPREDSRPSMPEPRPSSASIPPAPESVFDTARELLTSDFYLRKWGRLAMRGRSEEVDDFGYDPIYEAKLKPLLDFLYTTYFRVETSGVEHVPAQGRCVLVANHSGTLPLDGVMMKVAVKREHPAARDVRWLTEDFITHFPYLGSAMNRLGAVRANQENAERLLDKDQLVAVFPEGVKGIGKLFKDRYRLQRFGRGGFIKLCLRTSTPIVPVAVMGAEETSPLLFKIEHLSKALGVPYIPVTPTFPLLGPLGLLPAPTKWRIQFGEPLDLSGHGPEAADDEILVGKLGERVRASIQGMLDRAVGARKSVFFG